ncbi:MAG: hypothetical protein SGBAC_010600 [Bacillariaceae sp.]
MMLSSRMTTRLEAKGKNKKKNRDKNAEADGGEKDKIRSDGKRSGRRRKSPDPHANNNVILKKKKKKGPGRKPDGADPAKAMETQPRVVALEQLNTKRCWLRLETPPQQQDTRLPLDICLVEIQDDAWWKSQEEFQSAAKVTTTIHVDGGEEQQQIYEQEKKENTPYGARVWPPSMALAEFLSDYLSLSSAIADPIASESESESNATASSYQVLEIGCGTGLVSIAAALCGAKTMATDVAPMTLKLVQQGWSETCDKQRKHREKMIAKGEDDDLLQITDSNLQMELFDVSSPDPLPWPKTADGDKPQRILVASAVLYEASLAKAMAQCCFQACYQENAWVILADDDTGLREGGREVFETEWERLVEERKKKKRKSPWVPTTVEQKTVFGWVNKRVQLLHLNYPEELVFDGVP